MENNINKLDLLAQLQDKINGEYDEYKQNLYRMTVEEVILNSYKTVMLNEFKEIINRFAGDYYEDWQLKKLLKVENLLELLYADWIEFDSDEQDIYKEFIFGGYWDWEYLQKENKQ